MEQLEFDLNISVDVSKEHDNPMVRLYGFGPQDKRCKHCKHMFYKQYAKKYYKCDLRTNTNGAGTDHRVNWAACAKFED